MISSNVEMIEDISQEMSLPELVEALKRLADEIETVVIATDPETFGIESCQD